MSLASHCQNDEGQTEEADDTKDQAKGYAVGKNNFITVEDDELISFRLESTRTIEIDIFVPQKKVDPVILTPLLHRALGREARREPRPARSAGQDDSIPGRLLSLLHPARPPGAD
jgi:hypothetical protein